MSDVQIHALEEIKAKTSLEVANLRRELEALENDKEKFIKERETEVMAMVAKVLGTSQSLLDEALLSANSVERYDKVLKTSIASIKEARVNLENWNKEERKLLDELLSASQVKIDELSKKKEELSREREQLELTIIENRLTGENCKAEFIKSREERRKLMKNLEYVRQQSS